MSETSKTSYKSERIIDLSGTCPTGSLHVGDEIKLTFADEEWLLKVTRLRPFTVHTGEPWVDWEASGSVVASNQEERSDG